MWDGLLMLLFLSFLMATASFLAGYLPLALSLSSRQLRLITALGTGVLVGTSLIVIIPEGIETLYSSSNHVGIHARAPSSLGARYATVPHVALGTAGENIWRRQEEGEIVTDYKIAPTEPHLGSAKIPTDEYDPRTGKKIDSAPDVEDSQTAGQQDSSQHDSATSQSDAVDEDNVVSGLDGEDQADHDPHVWVGISLILGFVLMYLIDTVPRQASIPSQPQRFHISLGQFSFSRPRSVSTDTQDMRAREDAAGAASHSRPSSTTVGLVIHAAADGIALGASSTSTTGNLSFIIFIAIMIHKAPAAFGLTTVLLKQGLTRRQARAHLIVFALAAPAGALVTWTAIHLLGFSGDSPGSSASNDFATGVLLLFSGGTFLYVAMHTMQESASGGHEHGTNGYAGVPMTDMYASGPTLPSPKPQGPALLDTVITVAGMFLPLLAQWGDMH